MGLEAFPRSLWRGNACRLLCQWRCCWAPELVVGTYEFNNGLNGLGAVTPDFQDITSQKLQGIAITSTGDYSWRSYSKLQGDDVFEATFLHSLVHNIQEVGTGAPSLLVSHYSMLLEYLTTIETQARFSNDDLKGGYQKISFASDKVYDWIVDKYCPYGAVYALDESNIFWAIRRDFGWDDRGGAILKSMAVGGTAQDSVRGFYKAYLQLAYNNLNSHGVAMNIKVDTADLPR